VLDCNALLLYYVVIETATTKENEMKKQIIETLDNGLQIEKVQDGHGAATYKIKQGKRYIGKVSNGGYTTAASARKRAL